VPKRPLGVSVLDAARDRISWVFDHADKVYLSFSGGKDSTVMLHLTMDEAIRRGRKIGLLFIDLEAQYKLTIEHVQRCYDMYADHVEPYWLALPLHLRNAVSQYEPHWVCWQPGRDADWVRQPPAMAITDPRRFPWFREAMEFEELVDDFGHWYSEGKYTTACLVGIRADESLNRYRTLIADKTRWEDKRWTTWKAGALFNAYPIYDWRTRDIWVYHGKYPEMPYNALYDRMRLAGLSIHQQRICQPYGDDQRKGLWLYSVIEPETWGRVVARVNGANAGALYARDTGNILGRIRISCPPGHTWESFAELILDTLPPHVAEHYRNKIAAFIRYWQDHGYPNGLEDDGPATQGHPNWKRVCKMLLRNDYWAKGLSFTQTKSSAYENYKRVMNNRRRRWGIYVPTAGR